MDRHIDAPMRQTCYPNHHIVYQLNQCHLVTNGCFSVVAVIPVRSRFYLVIFLKSLIYHAQGLNRHQAEGLGKL